MSDEPKLLPCPFCGSEVVGMEKYGKTFFACTCFECGAKVDNFYPTPQKAIEAWNTRANKKEETK